MSKQKINSGLLSQVIKAFSASEKQEVSSNSSKSDLLRVDTKLKDTVKIEANTGNVQADSLQKVLKICNIDKNSWDVKDFNVKELASGKFLWTVHFKKGGPSFDLEAMKNELKNYSPKVPKINYAPANKNLLLEVAIFDAHIGKFAYKAEVGQDYDLKIASKMYNDAIDFAISNAKNYKVERIVFPVGQDFLHIDGKNNMTTAGTLQDADTRASKIFTTARQLLVDSIEKLKTIAPVDVVSIPGNHEENSMFHLADCIECRYWNDENVVVDNTPVNRKYYQWGKNLLGFAHGDKNKINDLALLMASEAPKFWSQTNYRYWRLGHFHHQKMYVDEKAGVIIEILPSLSATDAWHASKGYVKNIRGAVSSIYDKENGLVGKFYYNV